MGEPPRTLLMQGHCLGGKEQATPAGVIAGS